MILILKIIINEPLQCYKRQKAKFQINVGNIINIIDVYICKANKDIAILFKIYYNHNKSKFQMNGNMIY